MSSNLVEGRFSTTASRRGFLGATGSLSAVAVAMLAGNEALAQGMGNDPAKDVAILNVALGLEHEAINAYQLGAGSGLLQKPALDVALLFQSHHKGHRDALVATIQTLGGQPGRRSAAADLRGIAEGRHAEKPGRRAGAGGQAGTGCHQCLPGRYSRVRAP